MWFQTLATYNWIIKKKHQKYLTSLLSYNFYDFINNPLKFTQINLYLQGDLKIEGFVP